MKFLIKLWIALSLIIIVALVYKLFDTYTSLKYEVEEPVAMGKTSEILEDRAYCLNQVIMWLWVITGIQIINIAVLFKVVTKVRERSLLAE